MILWINWLSNSFKTFEQTLKIDPEIEFCKETLADIHDDCGFTYVGF